MKDLYSYVDSAGGPSELLVMERGGASDSKVLLRGN